MGISNALVVGGGIGGLATAAILAQKGMAVTLLEQTPALKEVGAGLQVSPNGLAVLRAIGVESALRLKGAVRAEAVVLRDYSAGAEVARLPLGRLRPDQPYFFLHRADLVDILAGAAKRANVTFQLGAQVASIHPGPTPQVQLTSGQKMRAELVIAADGIHSVGRPLLNGDDTARFSNQVAWRALIPNRLDHPDEAQVHMGPGRHLVSYPVRGGERINLVAVEEREDWAAEGWNHSDDPQQTKLAFKAFGGIAARMIEEVDEVTLWGLHLHPVAKNWVGEGLALVGDAAHPTLPFLAQGANLALEDAWVLASSVLKEGLEGLKTYQAKRIERARRVVSTAEKNAARYHLQPGLKRSFSHAGLRIASRVAPGVMVGAFDWLYGFDVTAKPKK